MSDDRMKRIHLKTKYTDDEGTIGFGNYADGQLAMLFAPDTGEPAWALSMNLIAYGLVAPENHVYVGGYSEHVGIPRACRTRALRSWRRRSSSARSTPPPT